MNLEVSEVLITHVTNRGKAEVILHIEAGQSSNYQIILELFGYDIFCNNLQRKKMLSEFGSIRGIITHVTYRGKARVMLHILTGQSNNHQIILELFGYDIFCSNLQCKKTEVLLRPTSSSWSYFYMAVIYSFSPVCTSIWDSKIK